MTQIPIVLLDLLKEKVKEVLKDMELIKPSKTENEEVIYTSINVYKQNRPVLGATQRLDDQIPFVQIQFDTGSRESHKIIFGIVVFDNKSDNQGHADAINIANKILMYFTKNRTVGSFACDIESFQYQILDEVENPYHAIAFELDFKQFIHENEEELEGLI